MVRRLPIARVWLAGLLALTLAACLSAGAGRRRDYWPTRGWRESAPSGQGLDPRHLQGLEGYIAGNLPLTSSLLVVRHGYIVYERYFQGGRDTPRALWSVTKSVLSTLIGIALQRGFIRSIDQPMLDFFPEFAGKPLDPQAGKITLRHLLTMSDGISGESLDFLLTEGKLSVPLQHEPGKAFYYNSMSPQVLSIILTRTTGLKARDFAMRRLFWPLGILEVRWFEQNGFSLGAFGLELSTRDLAKLGLLFLDDGRWAGRRIVPPEWIAEATRPQIRVPRTAKFAALTGPYFTDQYGFYWWLRPRQGGSAYMAQGFGGQFLYIVPELDLVIVITTNDVDRKENLHSLAYLALIDDFIAPAVIR
jgi:CubicO group peptidase (beta-lactamase class C family)